MSKALFIPGTKLFHLWDIKLGGKKTHMNEINHKSFRLKCCDVKNGNQKRHWYSFNSLKVLLSIRTWHHAYLEEYFYAWTKYELNVWASGELERKSHVTRKLNKKTWYRELRTLCAKMALRWASKTFEGEKDTHRTTEPFLSKCSICALLSTKQRT